MNHYCSNLNNSENNANNTFIKKIENILLRKKHLDNLLTDITKLQQTEYISFSKELSDISPISEEIAKYLTLQKDANEISNELSTLVNMDHDIKSLLKEELTRINSELEVKQQSIKIMLLPKDSDDAKNAIIEIRAGAGGDEASLFAAQLFKMYQKYTEKMKWKFEIISLSYTEKGGYKEAIASIIGTNVFARLKFESGVHRVQRVPDTESSGRLHTSTATVAVLSEAEEIDIIIQEKDIRVDVYRSSGPGGQSVNTTDSAVRITHIPTGIVVMQQDEKSQHKNRAKAMKILRARLYEIEKNKKSNERSVARKQQIGSGDRSERIRTYNFPQGRITDHRINYTVYKIESFVNEGDLNELIDKLIMEDQISLLSSLDDSQ